MIAAPDLTRRGWGAQPSRRRTWPRRSIEGVASCWSRSPSAPSSSCCSTAAWRPGAAGGGSRVPATPSGPGCASAGTTRRSGLPWARTGRFRCGRSGTRTFL